MPSVAKIPDKLPGDRATVNFWKRLFGLEGTPKASTAEEKRVHSDSIYDATREGDWKTVKALLKENPDLVLSRDYSGQTPLHDAALFHQTDVAKLLLDRKADVNAKDGYGKTPLHLGAKETLGKDVVRLLLAKNADVNARADDGSTPLHRAAEWGPKDTVDLLLAHKADVSVTDNAGKTPLHYACSEGVAELLLAKAKRRFASKEVGR